MLDEKAPVSLYYQLKQKLKKKIETGEWPAEFKIPPERELCTHYGVSRITVRQALDDIKREGYIYSKQGRGTFVKKPKIEQGLEKFYSFSEDIEKKGYKAESRILDFSIIDGEDNKGKLYKIKRLRYADGEAFAVETSYVPVEDHPDMSEKDVSELGLYNILKEKYNETVNEAEETFEVEIIDPECAVLLAVKKNTAAIILKRTAKANGKQVEYCETVIRGDRFKYKVILK